MVASTDGFALAATDLDLRGAGQLFGRRQSGLPDLRLARIDRDLDVIGRTRDLARAIVAAEARPDASTAKATRKVRNGVRNARFA
jgi:ATP-dependent DNA helicase RecG